MDDVLALLASEYGIVSGRALPVAGGFSTKAAYRVAADDGMEYFLKVYDRTLPTTRFSVERMDLYMPVLDWLSRTPALRGRILTPVPARNGAFKAQTAGEAYALFLYVPGSAPGIDGMSRAQTVELAQTLALLHEAGDGVPFDTPGLAEDISLPFLGRLSQFLDDMGAGLPALTRQIAPHVGLLRAAISEAQRLRDTVRQGHSPLVLCHGDAHGNNVIQAERLVLADWEDLRWAPAEADLFIHAWHPHADTLLGAYAAARRGYRVNAELLHFYVLRRRIEDIWVDIQRLTEEAPGEAEAAALLGYVRQSVESLQALDANKRR